MSSTSVISDPKAVPNQKQAHNQDQLIALANGCRIVADCFWEPRLPDANAWEILTQAAQQLGESALLLAEQAKLEADKLDLESLPVLFSHLLIGPFEVHAPAYASTYLDQEEAFAGRTQAEVWAYYRQGELELPPRSGETPDHLTVELEFLYYLLVKTIQEAETSHLRLAADFASNHLRAWLPSFTKQLESAPDAKFYLLLGKFAQVLAEKCTSLV